jgi:hypothetical protein
MFTAQLNWTDPSDLASQLVGRGNVAPGDDSEAAFALLYTEALGLATGQCPATAASVDDEGGLLATEDYGGPHSPSKPKAGEADATAEETWKGLLLGYNHFIAMGSGAQTRQSDGRDPEPEPPRYSSSMGRLTSQNRAVQVEPAPDTRLAPANSAPVLHKTELAEWMDAHALTRSSHHCAMYCRLGMEAAGLSTQDRPRSGDAADYGPFLLRHGAQVQPPDSYTPQVGDTVVFDKTTQHPYGHIEMYDGRRWVSDFMQHSFSPYRDVASTPPFTIYRLI